MRKALSVFGISQPYYFYYKIRERNAYQNISDAWMWKIFQFWQWKTTASIEWNSQTESNWVLHHTSA